MDFVRLARHGETEWNRAGRRQGRLDSPLTPDGLARTRGLAAAIARLPVDSLFSSPLGRAVTTAEIFSDALTRRTVLVDELSEVEYGKCSGLTNDEIERAFPGMLARRSDDHYRWRFPSGESYEDADRRASVALLKISATGAASPLIVSHEMIGRMLLRNLLDMDADDALATRQSHGIAYRIQVASRTLETLDLGLE